MSTHDFPVIWYEHRVSYGETDTMGVLYYAEYLHIFERGRTAYIRSFGVSYRTVEEKGLYLPVREADCRYRHPARYDDLLHLSVSITEWRRASLLFAYKLYDEDKQKLLAEGTTLHACVNSTGRPIAVPDWFHAMFV